MKQNILLSTASLLLAIFAFMPEKNGLVGHWTFNYPGGQTVSIEFRDDGTFEAVIPAEQFTVGGQYNLKDDILSISDSSCGKNYWGTYRETFFSDDSVYSTVIEDSCTGRRSAADKATLIRVKM